jgi:hypothetical protein
MKSKSSSAEAAAVVLERTNTWRKNDAACVACFDDEQQEDGVE